MLICINKCVTCPDMFHAFVLYCILRSLETSQREREGRKQDMLWQVHSRVAYHRYRILVQPVPLYLCTYAAV